MIIAAAYLIFYLNGPGIIPFHNFQDCEKAAKEFHEHSAASAYCINGDGN